MAVYSTFAAVDLGSNSFHLQVARVVGDQLYPLDSLREPVRIGAGLTRDKRLNEESQQKALDCLKRFGERLRDFDRRAVRAVGTNTLRVAKNAGGFLKQAQAALGFPIEVVAGREEARLIYLGVSHSLPVSPDKRLVVDIGGGSTEFIIGRAYKPIRLESLYMGCVSYSLKYFPDGKISKGAMKRAELAARSELQTMVAGFAKGNWQQAVGSSGSARALAEILQQNGYAEAGITPDGLDRLRSAMIKSGDVERLDLKGLRSDRLPVLPGGLAIMTAALSELGIESMTVAGGSMRQGILYDLLGRFQHHDMRDVDGVAVHAALPRRFETGAPRRQVLRSRCTSAFTDGADDIDDDCAAVIFHGRPSCMKSAFRSPTAAITSTPRISCRTPTCRASRKWSKSRLSMLVLAHRRSLKKIFARDAELIDWRMVMALRLAALFYRSRADIALPEIDAKVARPHAALRHRARLACQQSVDGHRVAGGNRGMGDRRLQARYQGAARTGRGDRSAGRVAFAQSAVRS